jgi:hypothetical protein
MLKERDVGQCGRKKRRVESQEVTLVDILTTLNKASGNGKWKQKLAAEQSLTKRIEP